MGVKFICINFPPIIYLNNMKKLLPAVFFVFVITTVTAFVFAGCRFQQQEQPPEDQIPPDDQVTEITSFEECVEAGNPILESYPRQCIADGETFTEVLPEDQIPSELPGQPQLPGQPDQPAQVEGEKEYHECTERPEICTFEYDPVCGLVDNEVRCITAPCPSFNAEDFGNSCSACSEGANGYYEGTCSDNIFVVCGETVTGFSPQQYVEDVNGICVDVCPYNFDVYTTQTGIEVCIEHYGKEEISQWETCERSTDTCECVKAYETTKGDPIEDPQYRCVPENYAERLLFRGGVDKLDENGEQSVAIA
jgi:hypothetical protein